MSATDGTYRSAFLTTSDGVVLLGDHLLTPHNLTERLLRA